MLTTPETVSEKSVSILENLLNGELILSIYSIKESTIARIIKCNVKITLRLLKFSVKKKGYLLRICLVSRFALRKKYEPRFNIDYTRLIEYLYVLRKKQFEGLYRLW